MSVSGFYKTEVIGALRPPIQVIQWNINRPSPSGWRQVESGVYKPTAKLGWRGGFTAQHESGVALDFGDIYVNTNQDSSFYTDTVCLTINQGEINSNPSGFFDQASGVGTGYKIYGMRFWLHNYDAISGYQPTFYYITHRTWHRGLHLTSGTAGVLSMPLSMPASQNIYKNGSDIFMSGVFKDRQFSDYIYAVALFPSGDYTLGTYGSLGGGDFTFKVSYDWTSQSANVLPTDME